VSGGDPSTEPNLSAALKGIERDPSTLIDPAASNDMKAAKLQTDEARELGIFGSPCFVVEAELFWGDDRGLSLMRRASRAFIRLKAGTISSRLSLPQSN
jgi:2-hydroxychromene-2-carboxylate isomerase